MMSSPALKLIVLSESLSLLRCSSFSGARMGTLARKPSWSRRVLLVFSARSFWKLVRSIPHMVTSVLARMMVPLPSYCV